MDRSIFGPLPPTRSRLRAQNRSIARRKLEDLRVLRCVPPSTLAVLPATPVCEPLTKLGWTRPPRPLSRHLSFLLKAAFTCRPPQPSTPLDRQLYAPPTLLSTLPSPAIHWCGSSHHGRSSSKLLRQGPGERRGRSREVGASPIVAAASDAVKATVSMQERWLTHARSRKWSQAPGNIEDLGMLTPAITHRCNASGVS